MVAEAPPAPDQSVFARIAKAARARPLSTLLAAIVATSVLFLIVPTLDIIVSGAFYAGKAGFPTARDPVSLMIREFGMLATTGVLLVALAGIIGPLLFARPRFGLRPHQSIYVLLVYVLGPGLLVNGFLKEYFGRPRPREITEFGGPEEFTSVWVATGGCSGNCSFVSGEAAAAAALLCLIPLLPRFDRLTIGLGIVAVAAIVSFNRVLVGAHFLSDVVLSWIIVLMIIVLMKGLLFGERGRRIDAYFALASRRLAFYRGRLFGTAGANGNPDAPSAFHATAMASSDSDSRRPPAVRFKTVSVVVPAKNEADNLGFLIDEIATALKDRDHEILIVDDGSDDGTGALLARLAGEDRPVRHIRHDRSAGQSRAIRSGVLFARGDVVATMDGDGQNDPAFIPDLVETLERAGPKVGLVAGQRVGRADTRVKKLSSRFANGVRQFILNDKTRDTGCGLKAMRTDLFRQLPYFDGWHRYFPALVLREGYDIVHLDVRDRPRRFGKSNYGVFDRGLRGILDLAGVWWLLRRARRTPAVSEVAAKEQP